MTDELRRLLAPLIRSAHRLPPGDRSAWLDALRGDAPVLADTLEQLLEESTPPAVRRDSTSEDRFAP